MDASQDFWVGFNALDWVIITSITLSMVISLVRGFAREVISLLTWGSAVWVSFHYTDQLSVALSGMIDSPVVRTLVSIAMLFFATLIAGVFLNVLIGGVMVRSRLSVADRFLGVVFGATRGVLLVTLAALVGSLTMFSDATWWHEAQLVPYFERNAVWLAQYLPEKVSEFVGNESIINESMVRDALAQHAKSDVMTDLAESKSLLDDPA